MFRWDDARILLALERERTLSGAARRLGIDATTVGRRISALERSLGQRLFERTPDGVLTTAVAEELLPFAESMEQAAQGMSKRVAGFEPAVEGVVRISVPPGVSDFLIAPRLAALFGRHPKLRIELDARVGYVDLARREADLALRAHRPERGDLVAVRLVSATATPFASTDLVERLGRVDDASRLPWITYGPDLAHIPDAAWVLGVASPRSLVLRTSSFTSQIAAAAAGVGVTLAASALVQNQPGLEPIEFTRRQRAALPSFPVGALYLVAHRSMRRVPRIAALWDFLLESTRDDAE